MECNIYKGKRKPGHYLFIPVKSSLEEIPDNILLIFGEIEWVMELDITPDITLAQSDPEEILKVIREKGFYIQLPPKNQIKI